ncbi:MAG: HAD-IA family hydrolase [Candidatus Polarisedimenticolia bacterium]
MSSIEAVFFDVGGTLVEVSPSVGHVYAGACARLGASVAPEAIQRAFDQAWVTLSVGVPPGADRYRVFDGGERAWWERLSAHAFDVCDVAPEHRPQVEDLRAVFAKADAWRIYPDVREALEALRRAGVRLGVISNWDSRLPALLDTLELSEPFETIVHSAAAGYEKPHPEIFRAALSALGVSARAAAHVGDRLEEDYEGARRAGLMGVLLQRDDSSWRAGGGAPGSHPDRVADLRELAERVLG